ncbi:hypothetical protein BT96DRAFT_947992 [Gymnopus androsaceus JB14]|uniref:Uncharacterized protein n=1 Tax=Gymnopus androsaceus JB14 TaxID=1447944 RepID=A0A6A4GRH7_9AGAR|nr:hypothetical protein BT96DRAFT_947992 [Gymnopus androsaceus JB14]
MPPKEKGQSTKTKSNKTTAGRSRTRKEKTDEVEEVVADSSGSKDHVRWNDALVEILLKELMDNPEIKQGLFPAPGTVGRDQEGNPVTKSNSRPKNEYYFMLAQAVFGDENSKYKDIFANKAKDASGKDIWATRIKNKLEELVRKYKKHKKDMGETGAGLTSEDQINMTLTNSLTTVWSKVKKAFPQYFTMHEIVGECPNITPVGLGNNNSEIDTSILRSSPDINLSSQNPSTPAANLDDFDIGTDSEKGEVDVDEDADGPESEKRKKWKRENRGSIELVSSQRPKFGPKEPKSEKVVKPTRKAATNPIERFVDLSKAEEVTIQKKLDAQWEKVQCYERVGIGMDPSSRHHESPKREGASGSGSSSGYQTPAQFYPQNHGAGGLDGFDNGLNGMDDMDSIDFSQFS